MNSRFCITARIFTAVVFCAAASVTTASATDYVITWKNQFASTAACSLYASLGGAAPTPPNAIQYKFTRLGETVQVVLISRGCIRITLSAVCKYPDAQGKIQTNRFSPVNVACFNHLVTLNPSIPGSFGISPGGGKTPLGL